ncbi:MAG: 50S ribosomal protein L17 [Peptococcaceae bacterium]|nr:50S ribosomal protein L17 [Peptococcaceae bacterium]
MLRNSVTSLLEHRKIETTEARAKEINALTEKMITLGKRNDLSARRQVMSYLFVETAPRKMTLREAEANSKCETDKDGRRKADENGRRLAVKDGWRKEAKNRRLQSVVKVLFEEIAPKYADRQGGYTRIVKTGYRRGDGAQMVVIELV